MKAMFKRCSNDDQEAQVEGHEWLCGKAVETTEIVAFDTALSSISWATEISQIGCDEPR
jgi:hypothetical protein